MPVRYHSRIPQINAELRLALAALVEESANNIADGARQRVPQDTGDLHDAIHVEGDGDMMRVVAGDDKAFYGHIVENGSRHTPPRPFLVPALEAERPNAAAKGQEILRRL